MLTVAISETVISCGGNVTRAMVPDILDITGMMDEISYIVLLVR